MAKELILNEKPYKNKDGEDKIGYSFSMTKGLPLQIPITFEKLESDNVITGESEYGTWYLVKGFKYEDKFVATFMSKKQLDDFKALPNGRFTITRVPLEITVKVKKEGKTVEIPKLVNGYEFVSLEETVEKQTTDPELLKKYLTLYKEHNKVYTDVLKFKSGQEIKISELIDEASFKEAMK